MAHVTVAGDHIDVRLSLLDELLAFHGSLHIPLAHVTNAFVSDFAGLELQFKLVGTNLGFIKTAGIFASPQGLIFCDVSGAADALVIETRGERFPRIAVQLGPSDDPNALAHEIMRRIPDAGPEA